MLVLCPIDQHSINGDEMIGRNNDMALPTHQINFTNVDIWSVNDNISVTAEPQAQDVPHVPLYVTIYVTIFNVAIFLVGVIGNILVIVVVAKVKDMRTSINLYLVNLSVADLLVLLVCQPTALLEFYSKERWYLGA
ncbi:unnamed protein product, partial [Candidula unifasciata]